MNEFKPQHLPALAVKQVSPIIGDVHALVARYGSDRTHVHTVGKVAVSPVGKPEVINGRHYQWCEFPDGRIMKVNAGNIARFKLGTPKAVL